MSLVVIGAAFFSMCSAGVPQVGQWGRFEASILNERPYADPYRDVDLEVTYTSPSGRLVEFWGFPDGSDIWRLRFMPDEIGRWQFTSRFSDGSDGASGNFDCVESDLPGMLSLDERNPLWFGFRGGGQLLVRSFHLGDRFFAANWPEAKRAAFLDWAGAQGYNMLSIASHYLNRDAEGRGRGWNTPDLWPVNPAEYRELEAILDDLAQRRLMVFPFAGFLGKSSDFPTNPTDQELYIRYTLARIGSYWNLLLSVEGPEPLLRRQPYLTIERIRNLGALIGDLDPYGHPVSVHNRTGDDPFLDDAWATCSVLQGPKTTDLAELSAGLLRNQHPREPLFAQETLWPGNKGFGHPEYSDEIIRKDLFVILMSAATLNYADMDGSSSSGFSGSLELADRHQHWHDIAKRAWDSFETFPFRRMRPRQDLVSDGYCLAEEALNYLVYLPEGGDPGLVLPDGSYSVSWITARNPNDRRRATAEFPGARLEAPDRKDWLLSVERLAE